MSGAFSHTCAGSISRLQECTSTRVGVESADEHGRSGTDAQGPTPRCAYKDRSGCPCVVGAAMTEETIGRIEYSGSLHTPIDMIAATFVNIDKNEMEDILSLQKAHDRWASAKDGDFFSESMLDEAIKMEKHFLQTLKALEVKISQE